MSNLEKKFNDFSNLEVAIEEINQNEIEEKIKPIKEKIDALMEERNDLVQMKTELLQAFDQFQQSGKNSKETVLKVKDYVEGNKEGLNKLVGGKDKIKNYLDFINSDNGKIQENKTVIETKKRMTQKREDAENIREIRKKLDIIPEETPEESESSDLESLLDSKNVSKKESLTPQEKLTKKIDQRLKAIERQIAKLEAQTPEGQERIKAAEKLKNEQEEEKREEKFLNLIEKKFGDFMLSMPMNEYNIDNTRREVQKKLDGNYSSKYSSSLTEIIKESGIEKGRAIDLIIDRFLPKSRKETYLEDIINEVEKISNLYEKVKEKNKKREQKKQELINKILSDSKYKEFVEKLTKDSSENFYDFDEGISSKKAVEMFLNNFLYPGSINLNDGYSKASLYNEKSINSAVSNSEDRINYFLNSNPRNTYYNFSHASFLKDETYKIENPKFFEEILDKDLNVLNNSDKLEQEIKKYLDTVAENKTEFDKYFSDKEKYSKYLEHIEGLKEKSVKDVEQSSYISQIRQVDRHKISNYNDAFYIYDVFNPKELSSMDELNLETLRDSKIRLEQLANTRNVTKKELEKVFDKQIGKEFIDANRDEINRIASKNSILEVKEKSRKEQLGKIEEFLETLKDYQDIKIKLKQEKRDGNYSITRDYPIETSEKITEISNELKEIKKEESGLIEKINNNERKSDGLFWIYRSRNLKEHNKLENELKKVENKKTKKEKEYSDEMSKYYNIIETIYKIVNNDYSSAKYELSLLGDSLLDKEMKLGDFFNKLKDFYETRY